MKPCKLCLKTDSPIRESHSIPRSVFKRLLSDDGKFVHHSIADDYINPKAQDQGKELMLCDRCEKFLSREYEHYTLGILRERYGEPDGNGIRLKNVNLHKINMYCLSVYWRCMVSDQGLFHAIKDVPQAIDYYRPYILNNVPISRPEFAVRILRLDGRSLDMTGEVMRGNLLNPVSTKLPGKGVVVRFVYGGYLFEKYPFCYENSLNSGGGLIIATKRRMVIPDTDVKNHEFIINAFIETHKKLNESGA